MQSERITTEIGTVCIKIIDGKIVSLKLPSNPKLVKKNVYPVRQLKLFNGVKYSYHDLLKLPIYCQSGTKFQKKIWEYLKCIPYGQTVTYAKIAKDLKLGKACRAVGQACKKNPIPVLVPCHRVIPKTGGPGGYSSGIKWKKFLLRLEKDRKLRENLLYF